jgi:hypothetical protein
MRHGAKPVPPGSVAVDGYWRRDDPLPALVYYPRNVADIVARHISLAGVAKTWPVESPEVVLVKSKGMRSKAKGMSRRSPNSPRKQECAFA